MKMLILTGPQGSGNHLFAKIFSRHPAVKGWMMNDFWEGHHTEPFSKYWHNPELLKDYKWNNEYYVTSISCPYYRDKQPHYPKYNEFIKAIPFKKEIAIIGRDPTILYHQQTRVRGEHTLNLDKFKVLSSAHFISTELLFLYKEEYLKYLSNLLDFPIEICTEDIINANEKYIKSVDRQPLDDIVQRVSLIES